MYCSRGQKMSPAKKANHMAEALVTLPGVQVPLLLIGMRGGHADATSSASFNPWRSGTLDGQAHAGLSTAHASMHGIIAHDKSPFHSVGPLTCPFTSNDFRFV